MRNSTKIILMLMVLAVGQASATGYGLKAGLWQTKMTKQVVDGQDRTAQMAGAMSKMQEAMANMPPEQRARIEAMMKQHGGAMNNDGTFKMCISPDQANLDRPIIDRDGHCQPATVTHSGNHTSFTINCSSNGDTTTGKGESSAVGNTITTLFDMTTHTANGETTTMHTESEMTFLGPDCGDVKPMTMPKPGQ
jgi:hypothetical protein